MGNMRRVGCVRCVRRVGCVRCMKCVGYMRCVGCVGQVLSAADLGAGAGCQRQTPAQAPSMAVPGHCSRSAVTPSLSSDFEGH